MELLRDFWAIIMAGLGGLVWLVRLEARTLSNETELTRQREQRHEDLKVTATARAETNALLAEIRADIKKLMERAK